MPSTHPSASTTSPPSCRTTTPDVEMSSLARIKAALGSSPKETIVANGTKRASTWVPMRRTSAGIEGFLDEWRPIFLVDTETGAKFIKKHVALCSLAYQRAGTPQQQVSLINPPRGTMLMNDAIAIHGLTWGKLRSQGEQEEDVLKKMAAEVASGIVVSHNVTFDRTFIHFAMDRHQMTHHDRWGCTLETCGALKRMGLMDNCKLDTAYEALTDSLSPRLIRTEGGITSHHHDAGIDVGMLNSMVEAMTDLGIPLAIIDEKQKALV